MWEPSDTEQELEESTARIKEMRRQRSPSPEIKAKRQCVNYRGLDAIGCQTNEPIGLGTESGRGPDQIAYPLPRFQEIVHHYRHDVELGQHVPVLLPKTKTFGLTHHDFHPIMAGCFYRDNPPLLNLVTPNYTQGLEESLPDLKKLLLITHGYVTHPSWPFTVAIEADKWFTTLDTIHPAFNTPRFPVYVRYLYHPDQAPEQYSNFQIFNNEYHFNSMKMDLIFQINEAISEHLNLD